jgi:hypothetical protein
MPTPHDTILNRCHDLFSLIRYVTDNNSPPMPPWYRAGKLVAWSKQSQSVTELCRLLADASHNLPRALQGDTGALPLTLTNLKAIAARSHAEIPSWPLIHREITAIIADLERLSARYQ